MQVFKLTVKVDQSKGIPGVITLEWGIENHAYRSHFSICSQPPHGLRNLRAANWGPGYLMVGFEYKWERRDLGHLVWFSDGWNPWLCRSLSVTRQLGTWILWESGYLAISSRGIWNAAAHWSVSGQSEEVYCQGFRNRAFGWDSICRAHIMICNWSLVLASLPPPKILLSATSGDILEGEREENLGHQLHSPRSDSGECSCPCPTQLTAGIYCGQYDWKTLDNQALQSLGWERNGTTGLQ